MESENQSTQNPRKGNIAITWVGRVLVILSFLNYYAIKGSKLSSNRFMDDDGFVFITFVVALGYFITILINSITYNKFRFLRLDKGHFSISVALLCISAYTLNLEFDVFEQFSLWCELTLFAILIPLFTNDWFNKLPGIGKWIYSFVMGFGMILALYFTIYLLPAWPLGVLAILFLGLGMHFFAPAILLFTLIVQYKKLKRSKRDLTGLLSGILFPVVVVIYLSINWGIAVNKIHKAEQNVPAFPREFPEWYYLSQQLYNDYFVDLVLQGNLAYSTPKNTDVTGLFNGRGGTSAYGDRFRHDPLIFTTALLGREINLDKETRFKLLEVNYASRHQTEEKLWAGKDLETKKIENNVQIFPEYRMAYNEKTITIHNGRKPGWRDDQEALYNFHLPEGASVSSLSLWVNGVERQSRLTTKKKASQAYNQIVGVQRRDPAIAHWQEGNRVTVRVFPCPPEEYRVFKVGITSPLLKTGETLTYSDTYLEGPILKNAEVVSNIIIDGKEIDLDMPFSFNKVGEKSYQYNGSFNNYLTISMKDPGLSKNSFCFNGNCYQLTESKSENKFKQYDNIYLDINDSWNDEEIEQVFSVFKNQKLWVYNAGKIKSVKSAGDEVISQLHDLSFNHIPLYALDSTNSLIITKNSGIAPNVGDLKSSGFAIKTKKFMANTSFVPDVFSLNYLNDYWGTLNQLQLVNVSYGDLNELKDMVINHRFEYKSENDDLVYIDQAEMMIVKTDSSAKSEAPDHLLRLFGYNQILKKIGRKFYDREQCEDDLLHIANEAFVLSPISSMVVLETDNDYDRFGIKENKNSLSNAKMKSSGSVPEPHELVLIFLGGVILMYLYRRKVNMAA